MQHTITDTAVEAVRQVLAQMEAEDGLSAPAPADPTLPAVIAADATGFLLRLPDGRYALLRSHRWQAAQIVEMPLPLALAVFRRMEPMAPTSAYPELWIESGAASRPGISADDVAHARAAISREAALEDVRHKDGEGKQEEGTHDVHTGAGQ